MCTLLLLSLSLKGISLSSKFEKFEGETRAEHFKKFPKVSPAVSMNTLLILP